jgi:hypothetical protein
MIAYQLLIQNSNPLKQDLFRSELQASVCKERHLNESVVRPSRSLSGYNPNQWTRKGSRTAFGETSSVQLEGMQPGKGKPSTETNKSNSETQRRREVNERISAWESSQCHSLGSLFEILYLLVRQGLELSNRYLEPARQEVRGDMVRT